MVFLIPTEGVFSLSLWQQDYSRWEKVGRTLWGISGKKWGRDCVVTRTSMTFCQNQENWYIYLLTIPIMKELLEVFNTDIVKSGSTITLTYCHHDFSGTCIYENVTTKGLNKPIVQNFFVLTSTDMGDVIEYIHMNNPLSGKDLQDINKLIRDHSLSRVRSLAR